MHAVSIAMSLVSNSRGWDTPVVIWLKCFDTHIFHYDVRFIAVNDGTNDQRVNGENFSALRSLFNKKRSSCLYLMTYYLGLIYFLCKHSKKRTQPRRHGTGGGCRVQNAGCVSACYTQTYEDQPHLSAPDKSGEKVRVTQQHPVKEKNVIDLHGIAHDQKPGKEMQKAEIIPNTVPYAKGRCGREK